MAKQGTRPMTQEGCIYAFPVRFKRTKNSKWENGLAVSRVSPSESALLIDMNLKMVGRPWDLNGGSSSITIMPSVGVSLAAAFPMHHIEGGKFDMGKKPAPKARRVTA